MSRAGLPKGSSSISEHEWVHLLTVPARALTRHLAFPFLRNIVHDALKKSKHLEEYKIALRSSATFDVCVLVSSARNNSGRIVSCKLPAAHTVFKEAEC